MSVQAIWNAVDATVKSMREKKITTAILTMANWHHLSGNVPHRRYPAIISDALTLTDINQRETWTLAELGDGLYIIAHVADATYPMIEPDGRVSGEYVIGGASDDGEDEDEDGEDEGEDLDEYEDEDDEADKA